MPDPWKLESFLDSLILELDRAADTLSIKGVTRKLTYTVRDVAVDLHVFPRYEHGELRFAVAKPGENGASRISFQLGSITDRQIRETANEPVSRDDLSLDAVEDLDPEVKDSLKRVGVHSTRDLDRLGERRVDVGKVVAEKTGGKKTVDYDNLAEIINKARRRKLAPRVLGVSAARDADGRALALTLSGENLMLRGGDARYPLALLNGEPVDVIDAAPERLTLRVPPERLRGGANDLRVALDPYAVFNVDLARGASAGDGDGRVP
jgi:hypothetical protein